MEIPGSIDGVVARLAAVSLEQAADAYLVGGTVRDVLSGRSISDIDLVVAGDIRAFAERAARTLGTHVVVVGHDPNNVLRLPIDQYHVDIVGMRGDLESDLAGRDFTVNALAIELRRAARAGLRGITADEVIDRHGGLADLRTRILRAVSPTTIEQDPVRCVRAVRLCLELGFSLTTETERAIHSSRGQLLSVGAERVGEELVSILEAPRAGLGVRHMDSLGVLGTIFPALELGREVDQRPVHRYRVLEHELVTLDWMDVFLAEAAPTDSLERHVWDGLWRVEWPPSRWADLRTHLTQNRVALRLAALLHDVGKPATRTVESTGRTRFFGHAEAGATLTRAALERWRLPRALMDRVALLVEQHMRPWEVSQSGEAPTMRALHRLHAALGDATPDVCYLYLADSLATVGGAELAHKWPDYVRQVQGIVGWRPAGMAGEIRRLVDGRAVMAVTHLEPGPEVGRILARIEEAANAGEVHTVEEALALAISLTGRRT